MGIVRVRPFDVLQSLLKPYGIAFEGASNCRVYFDVAVLKLKEARRRKILRGGSLLGKKMAGFRWKRGFINLKKSRC